MNLSDLVNRVSARSMLTPEEKAMVRDFEKAIKKHETDMKKLVKEYPEDEKIFKEDIQDLMTVFEWFQEGKFEHAYKSAEILDTAVREVIPVKLWDYMAKKSGAI